ncbi:MAG: hypothetical protein ACPH90_04330, partial [Crocinitomicaceae bacterium]
MVYLGMSLFARLIFKGLVLMIGFSAQSQSEMNLHIHCDTAHFNYSDYVDSLPYYQQRMGRKKDLRIRDKKLELAFYVALNRYPELHLRSIKLRLKSIGSTMQAQPTPNFMVKRKSKRAYRIFVNDNPEYTG